MWNDQPFAKGTSMKPTSIRRPAIVALLLTLLPVIAHGQEPYFPDLVFHPKDKEHNAIVDEITSGQLKALKEPSLWKQSQADKSANVYRFLWLGSYEHPASVRISRAGDMVTMHVTRHDRHPGFLQEKDHPKVTVDREVKLTLKQWEDFVGRLEAAKFWSAPTEVIGNQGIADGDRLLIEGIKGGKYHVVDRHRLISKKDYEPLFRLVFEAAGPDIVSSYDRKPLVEVKKPR
jgi:hypothetical protein